MRISIGTMGLVWVLGALPATGTAQAQSGPRVTQAQAQAQYESDRPAQSRRPRARIRIYRNDDVRGVYPQYNPGPNAVRDCTATLVQEFRPSGTVIVPRMNCFWRRG